MRRKQDRSKRGVAKKARQSPSVSVDETATNTVAGIVQDAIRDEHTAINDVIVLSDDNDEGNIGELARPVVNVLGEDNQAPPSNQNSSRRVGTNGRKGARRGGGRGSRRGARRSARRASPTNQKIGEQPHEEREQETGDNTVSVDETATNTVAGIVQDAIRDEHTAINDVIVLSDDNDEGNIGELARPVVNVLGEKGGPEENNEIEIVNVIERNPVLIDLSNDDVDQEQSSRANEINAIKNALMSDMPARSCTAEQQFATRSINPLQYPQQNHFDPGFVAMSNRMSTLCNLMSTQLDIVARVAALTVDMENNRNANNNYIPPLPSVHHYPQVHHQQYPQAYPQQWPQPDPQQIAEGSGTIHGVVAEGSGTIHGVVAEGAGAIPQNGVQEQELAQNSPENNNKGPR